MKANDTQVGGDHYKSMKVQPWDAMESWLSTEEFKGFLKGNAIKYLARSKDNKDEDALKARHYLEKLSEVITQQREASMREQITRQQMDANGERLIVKQQTVDQLVLAARVGAVREAVDKQRAQDRVGHNEIVKDLSAAWAGADGF